MIADGVHVAGPAIQVLLGTKGFDTVLLVSDGTAATGMRDGKYRLGNMEVAVKDGVVRNSEGKLAGSTLTIDRAIRSWWISAYRWWTRFAWLRFCLRGGLASLGKKELSRSARTRISWCLRPIYMLQA